MASSTDWRKAVSVARMDMMGGEPFFGSLSLNLEVIEDADQPTAWTDGQRLAINPEWFVSLSHGQRKALIAHEVMHCANLHPYRMMGREHDRWNIACDYAINNILKDARYDLPEGAHVDQYPGQTAEAIYRQLPPGGGGSGKGGGKGGSSSGTGKSSIKPWGQVRAPSSNQKPQQEQAQWQKHVLQAAARAKAQGRLPAGMDRLILGIQNPGCKDLVAALLEFASRAARDDYSWRVPNRRHLWSGLYLPGLYSESIPPFGAAVDTSGSIDGPLLSRFVGALQVVLDQCKPEYLRVLACDAAVHAEHRYEAGDLISDKERFPGGGGTDFRPVFDRFKDEPPVAMFYLTDLYGTFPEKPPEYAVLWVVYDPGTQRPTAPFGQMIYLDG